MPADAYQGSTINPPVTPQSPSLGRKVARGGALEFVLSVRFVLPFTVALVVLVMAVVTITLMALNTETAVETVVDDLHDQVLGIVRGRVRSHLETVLTVNTASAKYLARNGLPPPPANNTPIMPAHRFIVDILDDKINNFPVIDVHYIFYRNGRVIGVLRNDNVTNLYAEEFPNPSFTGTPSSTPTVGTPRGLYIWVYPKYDVLSNVPRYATPADVHVDTYTGYERSYVNNMRHDVAFDWAWTNPYTVGPFLL
ncbi:MAG: hypothetical protein Q8J97_15605, partial [Flavobacteriaceae bacterium]|nr:hypothetical protein [Flavobacteriaceae bacterium]